ncbi:hypothetical protein FOA52_016307 [Chlamydomonas sp. UWO 241]|nr:hypothetical protein FOA52_016307 [Chlamydomonas sp. UWO 241]
MSADASLLHFCDWLGELKGLVLSEKLTGFAIVTVKGLFQPVVGRLRSAEKEQLLCLVRTFGRADDGPDAYDLLGEHLQVVHRTPSSVFALGPRRELGVGAVQLSLGVLIVTFGRSTRLQQAVSCVEAAAVKLRV